MSKIIKMSADVIETAVNEFREALVKYKAADGKVNFSKTFGSFEKRAKLSFTDVAWTKMSLLVDRFDKEVAWHGLAKRGQEPNEYIIYDILVYPQKVTGATVTTDQEEYQNWLMELDDDKFNNLRMQGHSHVNMGVTPSSVDNSLYEKLLDQLDDTMFYIFMIFNKKGDRTIKIYDMASNTMFDSSDVDLYVLNDGACINKWYKESKELVKADTTSVVYAGKNTSAKSSTDEKSKKTSYGYGNYDSDYYYGGGYYSGYYRGGK